MLFSPDYWRKHIKPGVKEIIDVCHENNIPVIYHGCGNVYAIFEDFIEIGTEHTIPFRSVQVWMLLN
jgi:2-hydroxy-3-keto-5-methylthiopentenyl-1-phosphate phosphatase